MNATGTNESPRIALLALLAYTISVYTGLGERLDILSAIRHELLMGVVLIALSVWFVMDKPLSLQPYRHIILAIVLLFVSMLTQIPFAYDPQTAWVTFFDRIVKQAMFAFFIVALVRSPGQMRWFMAAFVFSIFYVLQESMVGLITGSLVWYNQGIHRLHGAITLYRHPNGLSLIAVTILPFIINLFPVVRSRLLRLGMLGTVVMAIVAVVYTGSRAGYIGIIAVLFFWWFFSKHKMKGILVGAVLATVVMIALPEQYKERFMSIGGQEKEGHSKDARILLMKDAWEIFQDNPGGVGVDCFELVREDRYDRGQGTHNLYLQVATHLGIQGFAIFLFFAGTMTWSLHQAVGRLDRLVERVANTFRRARGQPRAHPALAGLGRDTRYMAAVARACRLYIVMLLVNGIFAHTLYLICWWFLAGMVIAVLSMTDELEKGLAALQRRLTINGEQEDARLV